MIFILKIKREKKSCLRKLQHEFNLVDFLVWKILFQLLQFLLICLNQKWFRKRLSISNQTKQKKCKNMKSPDKLSSKTVFDLSRTFRFVRLQTVFRFATVFQFVFPRFHHWISIRLLSASSVHCLCLFLSVSLNLSFSNF